jgi:hypothetical protein
MWQFVHRRNTSWSDYWPSGDPKLSRASGFLDARSRREIRRPTGSSRCARGSNEYRDGNPKHGGKSV